jgi:hypothetical protein
MLNAKGSSTKDEGRRKSNDGNSKRSGRATYLPVNCFFTELAIINYTSECWSSKIQIQISPSHQRVNRKGRKVVIWR